MDRKLVCGTPDFCVVIGFALCVHCIKTISVGHLVWHQYKRGAFTRLDIRHSCKTFKTSLVFSFTPGHAFLLELSFQCKWSNFFPLKKISQWTSMFLASVRWVTQIIPKLNKKSPLKLVLHHVGSHICNISSCLRKFRISVFNYYCKSMRSNEHLFRISHHCKQKSLSPRPNAGSLFILRPLGILRLRQ